MSRSPGICGIAGRPVRGRLRRSTGSAPPSGLRSAVTLPVTAQSPKETSDSAALRGPCWIKCEVVLVGDRPFDQRDVDVLGILLDVGERAEDDVGHLRPGRSAIRPGRGTTCGSRSSRPARRWRASDDPLLLLPGGDEERELARGRAPSRRRSSPGGRWRRSGQACTHLPHEVQVCDSPQG